MYHCVKFSADEVYYLKDTDLCEKRILSVGFCPICNKPVAELLEYSFTGGINKCGKDGKIRQYACDFYGNKELIKKT